MHVWCDVEVWCTVVQFEIYVNEGKFIICNIDNALNSMQFDIIVQNFLNWGKGWRRNPKECWENRLEWHAMPAIKGLQCMPHYC